MTVSRLLAKLRTLGVLIISEGGRLIVDAPSGVLTAELRTELASRKADLISALDAKGVGPDEDPTLMEARREIAALLAIAYCRYSAIQRVGADPRKDSGDTGLANSGSSSVHGVDP